MNFDRILVIVARYVHTVSLNIIIMNHTMQHSKNADSVEMIKIQHFRPTSPQLKLSYSQMRANFSSQFANSR